MKAKREELAEALDGMFDDHHGELAGMRSALRQAANGAARTQAFLGERYHRILRRRGKERPWSPSPAPSWSSSGTC